MVILSPFVYWAQTSKIISLKIDLRNAEKPNIDVIENNIKFSAQGFGAHGFSNYVFNLDLFASIKLSKDEQKTTVKVYENRIEVVLEKNEAAWWPRLTAQPQKPAWLKINFDQWKTEDDGGSEEETRDVMKDYPGMYDKLYKEEFGYRKGKLGFPNC
ncbi:unnamed protein product [Pieris brassicae]|uniref:CS domain-containing protein n=1 Tax=Pieris brassicae TaxID=7116 RepID=A0A9P0T646_PIEBR|nr:unnamed protein product [Pieris brassicae]